MATAVSTRAVLGASRVPLLTPAAAPERNLDLLRAVAVLLVVVCHLFGATERTRRMPLPHELGSTGVLIFFVHTSLVLMLSMQRMKISSPVTFAWKFYVRRLFRIYPLSILTVILVFSLHIPEQALAAFQQPTKLEWMSNLLLVQNLARTRSAISPMWSLPWEVEMYLALPLLFVALKSVRYRVPAVVLLGVVAALLNVSGWSPIFKLLSFAPCFLGGILSYVLLRKARFLSAWLWPAALLLILSGYLFWRLFKPQGDYAAWLMCTVLGVAIPQFYDLPIGWLTKAAHVVAQYSYGIYLVHVPMIWFAFVYLGPLSFWVSLAIFLVAAVGLSVAAYHLVEEPMIGVGRRLSSR